MDNFARHGGQARTAQNAHKSHDKSHTERTRGGPSRETFDGATSNLGLLLWTAWIAQKRPDPPLPTTSNKCAFLPMHCYASTPCTTARPTQAWPSLARDCLRRNPIVISCAQMWAQGPKFAEPRPALVEVAPNVGERSSISDENHANSAVGLEEGVQGSD